MKVLQINSIYKNGSTGRTTYEVEQALIKRGHEAFIAYGYGDQTVDEMHLRINSKLSNTLHKVLSRLTGLEGYFSFFGTKRLIRFIQKVSPDVLHLRCLHGDYINLPLLFKYLKTYGGQVVVNLHDCWNFTGHCPYFGSCDKWKTECRNCDKYKLYPKSLFFDTSTKIYRDKKKWYGDIKNLHAIAVSRWLKELADESMLAGRDVQYLYNWINRDVFNEAAGKCGDDHPFTVVFVSASWEEGAYRHTMLNKIIELLPENYTVKIVGIYCGEKSKRKNVEYIGYVGDVRKLATIYADSNVYVHLSKEEAFGKVIAEANACGIPAIVFDISGCAEVVSEQSGYRVPVDDLESIVSCIREIEKNGKAFYKTAAINNVEENFNYHKNANQLIDLYEGFVGKDLPDEHND